MSQKRDKQSREKHQLEHQDRRSTRSVSRQRLNQAPELLSSITDDVERNSTLRPQELRRSRRKDASASDLLEKVVSGTRLTRDTTANTRSNNGVVASNSSIKLYYCLSNNAILI
jgi:hypothetical protein